MSTQLDHSSVFPAQNYRNFTLRLRAKNASDQVGLGDFISEVLREPDTARTDGDADGSNEIIAKNPFGIDWSLIARYEAMLEPPTFPEAMSLGKRLRECLLGGEVWQRFEDALNKSRSEEMRLRLKIFVEAPDLKLVPWEYTYVEEWDLESRSVTDPWLAMNESLSVVRQASPAPQSPPLVVTEQVRVLLVYSDAYDPKRGMVYVDTKPNLERVCDTLKSFGKSGHLFVDGLWNPDPEEVRDKIKNAVGGYHILIYGGHGFLDTHGKSGLLIGTVKSPKELLIDDLATYVHGTSIRVVYLGGCLLADMAPALIESGVAAVVANRFNISAQAEGAFSGLFCDTLTRYKTLDEAVVEGRKAVAGRLPGPAECLTPVLFSTSSENKVFALQEEIDRGNYLRSVIAEHQIMRLTLDPRKPLSMKDYYVAHRLGEEEPEPARPSHPPSPEREEPKKGTLYPNTLEWRRAHGDTPEARRQTVRTVSVEKALANHRIVIVGDPGSGKTTLTKHLAFSRATDFLSDGPKPLKPKVPLMIRLGEWSDTRLDFSGYLKQVHPRMANTIEEWMQAGECLLLLDGLDEVARRGDFINQLLAFLNSPLTRDCDIVITTRIVGYHNELTSANFTHYELLPFENIQIRQYVKWYISAEADRTEKFMRALQSTPQMRPLAANPLLLTIMCFVFDTGKELKLPARRIDLYDLAVSRMMDLYETSLRGGNLPETEADNAIAGQTEVLEKVSLELFEQHKETFTFAEIKGLIGQSKISSLQHILDHSGLLVRLSTGQYLFLHLTFQEYFAANALARRDDWLEFSKARMWDDRWEEVLRLMCARMANEQL